VIIYFCKTTTTDGKTILYGYEEEDKDTGKIIILEVKE
jgi:hypothetical protein